MAVLSSPLVLLQAIPPVTRAFTGATIVSSALYAYLHWKGLGPEAIQYMLVVPGSALYAPWTLLTSAFVETTIFEVSDVLCSASVNWCLHMLAVHCYPDFRSCIIEISGEALGKH